MEIPNSRDFRHFLYFSIFDVFGVQEAFQWIRNAISTRMVVSKPRDDLFSPLSTRFCIFWDFRFCELQLFLKKSIPVASSGQSPMWKMIAYWFSSYELFTKSGRLYWFLPRQLHFFMKNHFSILTCFLIVKEGFCGLTISWICSWKTENPKSPHLGKCMLFQF